MEIIFEFFIKRKINIESNELEKKPSESHEYKYFVMLTGQDPFLRKIDIRLYLLK